MENRGRSQCVEAQKEAMKGRRLASLWRGAGSGIRIQLKSQIRIRSPAKDTVTFSDGGSAFSLPEELPKEVTTQ